MHIPFITRAATCDEVERLRLYMSTFTDGSGYERNDDGTTRPGWRDIERVVAEFFHGNAPEGKGIFDVIVPSNPWCGACYGISVKSKGFSLNKFNQLSHAGRAYMELCNSPAKLWKPLKLIGIYEDDFSNQRYADEIGSSILETIESWYMYSGIPNIDISNSVHLTVSYHKPSLTYQIHTFALSFPKRIIWRYNDGRSLRGYDSDYPDEVLFDFYALSGGQVKYYPKVSNALYCSRPFSLERTRMVTIAEKAAYYWD